MGTKVDFEKRPSSSQNMASLQTATRNTVEVFNYKLKTLNPAAKRERVLLPDYPNESSNGTSKNLVEDSDKESVVSSNRRIAAMLGSVNH
jgi:hypothetical protein